MRALSVSIVSASLAAAAAAAAAPQVALPRCDTPSFQTQTTESKEAARADHLERAKAISAAMQEASRAKGDARWPLDLFTYRLSFEVKCFEQSPEQAEVQALWNDAHALAAEGRPDSAGPSDETAMLTYRAILEPVSRMEAALTEGYYSSQLGARAVKDARWALERHESGLDGKKSARGAALVAAATSAEEHYGKWGKANGERIDAIRRSPAYAALNQQETALRREIGALARKLRVDPAFPGAACGTLTDEAKKLCQDGKELDAVRKKQRALERKGYSPAPKR